MQSHDRTSTQQIPGSAVDLQCVVLDFVGKMLCCFFRPYSIPNLMPKPCRLQDGERRGQQTIGFK